MRFPASAVSPTDPSDAIESRDDRVSALNHASPRRPIAEDLPDLSSLSLSEAQAVSDEPDDAIDPSVSPRRGRTAGVGHRPAPTTIHITVHAHASTVIVNAGSDRDADSAATQRRDDVLARSPRARPRGSEQAANVMSSESARGVYTSGSPLSPAAVENALDAATGHGQFKASPSAVFATPPSSPVSRSAGSRAHPSHLAREDGLAGLPSVPVLPWDAGYEHIAPPDPRHNRWYVVTAGRKVGIWRTWLEMSVHVTRVTGNMHQSFKTRAEAEAYYTYNKERGRVVVIAP